MEWKKCRKKPIVVEFREVQGEKEEIKTREGTLKGYRDKDFIIRGLRGEVYPIGKDIFHKSYDVLEKSTIYYLPPFDELMVLGGRTKRLVDFVEDDMEELALKELEEIREILDKVEAEIKEYMLKKVNADE